MPTTKRKNVLVVDDDQAQRALIKRILEIYQLHVHLASSGAEAIAMLTETIPDLIILDMHMPEMSGRETLQQMKTLLGDQLPPVIGLSGAAALWCVSNLLGISTINVYKAKIDKPSWGAVFSHMSIFQMKTTRKTPDEVAIR